MYMIYVRTTVISSDLIAKWISWRTDCNNSLLSLSGVRVIQELLITKSLIIRVGCFYHTSFCVLYYEVLTFLILTTAQSQI